MSEPVVVTLGCRLNAFESAVIRREAAAAGVGDAVIVNTCAVTGEAVRQARQTIRKLHRQHPGRPIIVTGCAAQLDPGGFGAMPEVTRVLGNAEKLSRVHLAGSAGDRAATDTASAPGAAPMPADSFDGRARAFVQIQQGCDHRCTFCVIPFARGPNRSLPEDLIIAETAALTARGFREVVLTGVDICSYARDRGGENGLGRLVRRLLRAVPALPRLRLSTLDPAAIDDDLLAALADEPRLMPHWHLSLQALNDLVLKRMRRRHRRRDVIDLVNRARALRPDVVFGADLIAGFPTETAEMFADTADTVAGLELTWLHVFPYSPRAGTPAARMPQVPKAVREARAASLRLLGDRARARYLEAQVGAATTALVEQPGLGRTPGYAKVRIPDHAPPGAIVSILITAAAGDRLIARLNG